MNKKQLEIKLSSLKNISKPKAGLEQYSTDVDIAAEVLWFAFMHGDIKGKIMADLGCGNGILGIGALILGAKKVYFVDKDEESLKIAKKNCEFKNVEFLSLDVEGFNKKVDLVLENPPFGVQKRKADKPFLETAMKVAKKVYSFHKIESKNFIDKLSKERGFLVKDIFLFDFKLRKSMWFHKKNKYKVRVGCWVLEKRKL